MTSTSAWHRTKLKCCCSHAQGPGSVASAHASPGCTSVQLPPWMLKKRVLLPASASTAPTNAPYTIRATPAAQEVHAVSSDGDSARRQGHCTSAGDAASAMDCSLPSASSSDLFCSVMYAPTTSMP
jgi:hypothetical protein